MPFVVPTGNEKVKSNCEKNDSKPRDEGKESWLIRDRQMRATSRSESSDSGTSSDQSESSTDYSPSLVLLLAPMLVPNMATLRLGLICGPGADAWRSAM